MATPGVHPALGQEAVLILSLEVLGRLQPAAPRVVLQALAVEHGLVCGSLPGHLSCICLVLGNLPPVKSPSDSQSVNVLVNHPLVEVTQLLAGIMQYHCLLYQSFVTSTIWVSHARPQTQMCALKCVMTHQAAGVSADKYVFSCICLLAGPAPKVLSVTGQHNAEHDVATALSTAHKAEDLQMLTAYACLRLA